MAPARPRPPAPPCPAPPSGGGRDGRPGAAAQRGAHLRTRRPAGAQLAPGPFPDGVCRRHRRRSHRRTDRPGRAGPRSGRSRRRSLAAAAPSCCASPSTRPWSGRSTGGGGRPRHDVHHRLRPGLPGRRGGARTARLRAPLAADPSAGRGPGGGVRQLAVPGGPADALAVHAPVPVGRPGPEPDARPGRAAPAPGRLGRARPGHAGAVRTGRGAVGRPRRAHLPRLDPVRGAPASGPERPRLPHHHAVPAGAPARAPGAAHDRRTARRRRLDRAARRHDRPVRRPGGGRDGVPDRQAARRDRRHRRRSAQSAVDRGGP